MHKISNAALEEAVLCILAFSNENAIEVALRINDAKIFSNKTNQVIAAECLEYIKKYNKPPGVQLEYLLENQIHRGEEGKLISQSLTFMKKQIDNLQPKFVIDQLSHFLETRKLQTIFQNALELVDQGENEEAKKIAYKQIAVASEQSRGISLFDPKEAFRFLESTEEEDYFSSGIELLDKWGTRPERKTLTILIASSGKGKTWYLVNSGKCGLQHKKKVLHITLEISEEHTARRYLQSLFSLTQRETESVKLYSKDEEAGILLDDPYFREFNSVVEKKKELKTKLADIAILGSYPPLLIKEFPTSTLTVEHLCLYLDTLERDRGFNPDLLIIDYPDLMYLDTESLRIDTGQLYRSLRGVAVSRNLALVVASQSNREGEDAKIVSSSNVAEDWSKIGTADTILTYSQTIEEKKLDLGRIFVAKSRNSSDRYMALISQAYAIGQFAIHSAMMTPELMNKINPKKN